MQGMFEEYQNWQVKLIDNKIVLEEEPPTVKTENAEETENYVKTEFVVNGTQAMEVQENKENQASPAKKVKRELWSLFNLFSTLWVNIENITWNTRIDT